jgi:hypothetical protein
MERTEFLYTVIPFRIRLYTDHLLGFENTSIVAMASTTGAHRSFSLILFLDTSNSLAFFCFLDIANTDRIADALKNKHPAIDTSSSQKPGMTGILLPLPRRWIFLLHQTISLFIYFKIYRYFGYTRRISRHSRTGGRDRALDLKRLDIRLCICFLK